MIATLQGQLAVAVNALPLINGNTKSDAIVIAGLMRAAPEPLQLQRMNDAQPRQDNIDFNTYARQMIENLHNLLVT